MTVEQQLEKEQRFRPIAMVSALVAGLLTLGGGIAASVVYRNLPNNSPAIVLFMHHKAVSLMILTVLLALGAALFLPALLYLYDATKFRRNDLWKIALYLAIFGPIVLAASSIAQQTVLTVQSAHFAHHGAQTYPEAHAILTGPGLVVPAGFRLAGQLALGFALVLICLQAMRAGLLSRFMGFLGIIVGVLFVLPIGTPLPIVQAFWLLALGYLFSGRWPNGTPKAWSTGKAEPWPSAQQMREQRAKQAAEENELNSGENSDSTEQITPPQPENSFKRPKRNRRR